MSIDDIIIGLYIRVDMVMGKMPKHPQAELYPSELFTIGLLFALKGESTRRFYTWLNQNHRKWFPRLPEHTRPFRLLEVVHGVRRDIRFYQFTRAPENLPVATTRFVMTDLPADLRERVGNLYGLRTWIEYGFKQIKNELGWADNRLTDYTSIERWWELVFSAYLLVSLQTLVVGSTRDAGRGKELGSEASRVVGRGSRLEEYAQ